MSKLKKCLFKICVISSISLSVIFLIMSIVFLIIGMVRGDTTYDLPSTLFIMGILTLIVSIFIGKLLSVRKEEFHKDAVSHFDRLMDIKIKHWKVMHCIRETNEQWQVVFSKRPELDNGCINNYLIDIGQEFEAMEDSELDDLLDDSNGIRNKNYIECVKVRIYPFLLTIDKELNELIPKLEKSEEYEKFCGKHIEEFMELLAPLYLYPGVDKNYLVSDLVVQILDKKYKNESKEIQIKEK